MVREGSLRAPSRRTPQAVILSDMHGRRITIGALAALAALPAGTALAATINGGPGNERLRGTNVADVIDGNGRQRPDQGLRRRRPAHRRARQRPRLRRPRQRHHRRRPGQRRPRRRPRRRHGHRRRPNAGDLTSYDRLFGGSGQRQPDAAATPATASSAAPATTPRPATAAATGWPAAPATTPRTAGAGNDDDLRQPRHGHDQRRRRQRHPLGDGALRRAPGPGDQVGDTLDGGTGNDRFRTRDGEVDRITCGDGNDRALLGSVRRHHRRDGRERERLVRARRPQGAAQQRVGARGGAGGACGAQPDGLRLGRSAWGVARR